MSKQQIKIHEFTATKPIMVRLSNGLMTGIPEGGRLGFCGMYLYEYGPAGWARLTNDRKELLKWLENGDVTRKLPTEKDAFSFYYSIAQEEEQRAKETESTPTQAG